MYESVPNAFTENVRQLLGKKAVRLVGLSEETPCYVSPAYFTEGDPFADFVVHEPAHIFHNCERCTIGIDETRTKEWLLDIDFMKRETFAYSCEAYARIIARAKAPAERRALAVEYGSKRRLSLAVEALSADWMPPHTRHAPTHRRGPR